MQAAHSGRAGFSTGAALAGAALLLAAHLARAPFHELWRDEWQTWLTVASSADLSQLIWNTRYDGHPTLWVGLVWLAWRVLPEPWVMQAIHAVISAAWAFVVLRWAPFPRWASLLFLAGYYPFFEYAVISRNYVLAGLLAAVVCALLSAARLRPLMLGAALGLLAWTSAYGSMLSVAFLVVLAAETVLGGRLPAARLAPRRGILAAFAVGAGVTAAAIVDGLPAAGSGFANHWNFDWDLRRWVLVTRGVFRAFVPVPAPGVHFWNSNAFDGHGLAQAALGVGIVLLVWWLLRGHAHARLLWFAGSATLLTFAYVKLLGSMRHHGFFLLCAFCACWLAAASEREQDERDSRFASRRRFLVAGALALHVAVAVYATVMDLRHPFSASVEAAAWIKAQGLARLPIVAEADTRSSPLAGLLGKPLFYVRGRRWGTFVIFDRDHARPPNAEDIRASVEQVSAEARDSVLVVWSQPPPPVVGEGWRLLATFGGGVVADEAYSVYLVERAP